MKKRALLLSALMILGIQSIGYSATAQELLKKAREDYYKQQETVLKEQKEAEKRAKEAAIAEEKAAREAASKEAKGNKVVAKEEKIEEVEKVTEGKKEEYPVVEKVEEEKPKTKLEKLEKVAGEATIKVNFYERVVRSVAREEREIKKYDEETGKKKSKIKKVPVVTGLGK